VTVTVATTAETGVYTATFTTLGIGDGWAKTDHLELLIIATIDTKVDRQTIWDSDGDPDAPMRGTDSALTTLGTNAPANWINAAAIDSNAITDTKINDGALTAAKFASGAFDAVWSVTARTLSAISDSAGITTLLTRITGLLQTKSEADTDQAATIAAIGGIAPLDATQTQAASAAAITAADLATKTDVQNASLL
jgi:hypothetical protein